MLSHMITTTHAADLAIADGAVSATINYKGILTDASGTPMATTTSVVFTIYDQPRLGSVKWTETHDLTSDAEGRFNIPLGQTTPFHDGLFETTPLYLSVQVGANTESIPRTVITGVPVASRLDVAASDTVNRVAGVLTNESGSVMGVRDPGGNVGGETRVMGVRDPGGNIASK